MLVDAVRRIHSALFNGATASCTKSSPTANTKLQPSRSWPGLLAVETKFHRADKSRYGDHYINRQRDYARYHYIVEIQFLPPEIHQKGLSATLSSKSSELRRELCSRYTNIA